MGSLSKGVTEVEGGEEIKGGRVEGSGCLKFLINVPKKDWGIFCNHVGCCFMKLSIV
jgi:hypothetical protein